MNLRCKFNEILLRNAIYRLRRRDIFAIANALVAHCVCDYKEV